MFNILVLMKSLTLNKAAFIELKYSKISNISKYYCNLFSIVKYLKNVFIPVMQNWFFSIITSVFSVTWSFRNLICGLKMFFDFFFF